jgi:hypothetical protein
MRPITKAMKGFLPLSARRLSWREGARAFQASWGAVYRSRAGIGVQNHPEAKNGTVPHGPGVRPEAQFPVTSGSVAARYVAELENERIMILRITIGVVVGGGLGFAYYKFVGCSTGTCPLTSNPFLSAIYGSVVGALVAGSFH